MANNKNKNKARQRRAAAKKKQKLITSQKQDVANFLTSTAANAAGAGLVGIAVTKGDNIGVTIGLVLVSLGLVLQLIALRIKR